MKSLPKRSQSEKVVNALQKLSFRLDEMDGMYDDMQERLYEVDKSRKNNLVFYGVPQQRTDEDPDETERLIKSVITTKLQVCILRFVNKFGGKMVEIEGKESRNMFVEF